MDPSSPNPTEGAWLAAQRLEALAVPNPITCPGQQAGYSARPNRDVFVHRGGLSFPLPRKKVCRWEPCSGPAHTGLRGLAGSKEVQVPNGAPTYPICMPHQGNCAANYACK